MKQQKMVTMMIKKEKDTNSTNGKCDKCTNPDGTVKTKKMPCK